MRSPGSPLPRGRTEIGFIAVKNLITPRSCSRSADWIRPFTAPDPSHTILPMGALSSSRLDSRSPRSRDRRPRIFISYRRSDSAAIVGHIYERLAARYKAESVFRDINKMPLGKNFYEHIKEELAGCDIVLVVIGPQWLAIDAQGQSRIQQADDPVRLEVEAALASGATVIPVLVEGAAIPKSADLPESLKEFPALAGTRVNIEDFDTHIERLSQSIDDILGRRGKSIAYFPAWALRAAAGLALG